MEITIDIPATEAERLHIDSDKLTLEELKRKLALAELDESFKKSHEAAKKYGMDKWTMDDINQLVKEAKAAYNEKNSD